jgi:hypothetical protein
MFVWPVICDLLQGSGAFLDKKIAGASFLGQASDTFQIPIVAQINAAYIRRVPAALGRGATRRKRHDCRVGPGNFTPSLSQIPDVNLSIHPARATARGLPPSFASGTSPFWVEPAPSLAKKPQNSTEIVERLVRTLKDLLYRTFPLGQLQRICWKIGQL